MRETFYNGAQGNLSRHIVTVALATFAASAEKVVSKALPVGTEIVGVNVIHENLGANTAVKLDLVNQSNAKTELLASTTTTSAGTVVEPLKPVYIGEDGPSDLVLTNSGTGEANGEVTLQVDYRFKGY